MKGVWNKIWKSPFSFMSSKSFWQLLYLQSNQNAYWRLVFNEHNGRKFMNTHDNSLFATEMDTEKESTESISAFISYRISNKTSSLTKQITKSPGWLSFKLFIPHRVQAADTEFSYIDFIQSIHQCGFDRVPHSLLEGSETKPGSPHQQVPPVYALSHVS